MVLNSEYDFRDAIDIDIYSLIALWNFILGFQAYRRLALVPRPLVSKSLPSIPRGAWPSIADKSSDRLASAALAIFTCRRQMKTPNFFIVGAPKCGTTALSEYLRSNPSVFMSEPKELHFFCDDLNIPGRITSMDRYLNCFIDANEKHQAIGEASPLYLLSEKAISNLYKFSPDAKIIVMLRSTPEYLFSYYTHLLYLGDESAHTFEAAWDAQADRKAGRCKYPFGCKEPKRLDYRWAGQLGKHSERILSFFPNSRVKFIFLEDLKMDPRKVYLETLNFIGADDDGRNVFHPVNVNKQHRIKLISTFLNLIPPRLAMRVNRVKRLVGASGFSFTATIFGLNTRTGKSPSINSSMRSQLIGEFRDDILLLSRLTKRDLSHWL